jgi:hypothetical protein
MRRLAALDVAFAFPTQTVWVRGREAGEAAEAGTA